MTFEDYLKDLHAEQYHGTDDDMPDDFERWLEMLEQQTILAAAESYSDIMNNKLIKALHLADEAIEELKKVRAMLSEHN